MKKNILNLSIKSVMTIVCFFIILIISSCPTPITEKMFLQVKDEVAPGITILSPADGSSCAKSVIVTGTVSDLSTDSNNTGGLSSLSYEILSADIAEEIPFDEEGSFSFSFSTITLGSTFVLKITAIDWNGNVQAASITLNLMEGNDIPSFSVVPGNKLVTLTWDEVPLSTGYSLLYSTNGTIPSELYGYRMDDVDSGLEMSDLENDAMHVFILQSHSSAGDDNWSVVVRAIPLSPATLAPTVTGSYGAVEVGWLEIPATDTFEVWRATDIAGPFSMIASDADTVGFTDTFVNPGDYYFYKVRPALAGSIMSNLGAGTPGVFYPYGTTRIGTNMWADNGAGVAARGDYAYVANRGDGLISLDVSDRYQPVLLDTLDTGTAEAVWLYDNYAYVADSQNGLKIVNISDPRNLVLVDWTSVFGSALGVEVADGRLYVAAANDGLYVYDIDSAGSPTAPVLIDSFATASAQDVAVEGVLVCVATAFTGSLVVVDTSVVPFTKWGLISLANNARGVDVKDGYAYVALESAGITIVDISLSKDPFDTLVTYDTDGQAQDVLIHRNRLYVADLNNAGLVFDVSDPTVVPPAPISLPTGINPLDVYADGDYIYFGTGFEGLVIFISTLPTGPQSISICPDATGVNALAVDGPYAYVTEWATDSIMSVNVSDPTNPVLLDTLVSATGQQYNGIAVGGGYAYVVDGSGIGVIDVSDPTQMVDGGYCEIWDADVIELQGQYAYVTNWGTGLHIVDISDPMSPAVVGSTFPFYSGYMDVQGNYCYITDNSRNRLLIFDVSVPSAPVLVFEDSVVGAWNVEVEGDYAFVANDPGTEWIDVYDVSNPAAAVWVSEIETSRVAEYMYHDGHYLYISTNDNFLEVIDTSDPAALVIIGSNNDYISANGLAVSGQYAYSATSAELVVIDLLPD